MTKEEKLETAGLKPMGIRRLQELRRENETLRAVVEDQAGRIKALEQALQEAQEGAFRSLADHPPSAGEEPVIPLEDHPPDPEAEAEVEPEAEADPEADPTGPGEAPAALRGGRRVSRETRPTRRRIAGALGNVAFYLAIVLALTGTVFIRAAKGGTPFTIAGYSGMLVLSESMRDAIPKGSFILTKSVAPETLKPGDDITYMVNPTTSVTHRIMEVQPQPDGTLTFQTQGVSNTGPDSTLVPADHIVGKVIYHSLLLGLAAQSISDNWPLLLFLLGVWTALGWTLSQILGESRYRGKRLACEPAQSRPGGMPFVTAIKRRMKHV